MTHKEEIAHGSVWLAVMGSCDVLISQIIVSHECLRGSTRFRYVAFIKNFDSFIRKPVAFTIKTGANQSKFLLISKMCFVPFKSRVNNYGCCIYVST